MTLLVSNSICSDRYILLVDCAMQYIAALKCSAYAESNYLYVC